MERGTLRITACSDSIVRVTYAPGDSIPDTPQYAITKKDWPAAHWCAAARTHKSYKVSTPLVSVTVTKKDGTILFADAKGRNFSRITTDR